ncbi:ABC transporter permease [Aliifodinibius sp. S!AR15-10]|uniref:ABC transporter permease n=1 Tax=Aliifodinibius sp. S!AR15-10 TaxID=2950437 RepID=UPI002856E2DB|nr:ABC transporter permease [Aliifodinibius sp. S!AR15-10]MDR8393655.1 ABC transporter permease [Aliifodinibius sp. S!AR15-10]
MRTIFYLVQKEFLQILRDKAMLFILFAVPIIQLVVLAYAATFELKDAEFHLVDHDQSTMSTRLANTFESTGYFTKVGQSFSDDQGIDDILKNQAKMVMVIPNDFEKDLRSGQVPSVQFIISAVDGSTAGLIQSYSQAILRGFGQDISPEIQTVSSGGIVKRAGFNITTSNWYNSTLDYIMYMVPGIITILVTLICLLLSVLNIVREREIGTIEQINVTPIKKYQFIAGKLVPTWILAMLVLTVGLLVSYLWFEIPFRGNVLLIYGTAAIYLLAIQGLGLLISSASNTQQQAMFINFFCVMVFMLMGGIFTPIESMPQWAQQLTVVNPIAYFGKIMRMVLLKGSGWADIQHIVAAITLMAVILLPVAVASYRKRTS